MSESTVKQQIQELRKHDPTIGYAFDFASANAMDYETTLESIIVAFHQQNEELFIETLKEMQERKP